MLTSWRRFVDESSYTLSIEISSAWIVAAQGDMFREVFTKRFGHIMKYLKWHYFAFFLLASISGVPFSGAMAKGLALKMNARVEQNFFQVALKVVGPADDPDAYVFSCPSADLKECLGVLFRDQDGVSPETGEPVYLNASVEIHHLRERGRSGAEMVWASVYSPWHCGVQNCPILVFRRTGPNSWEEVLDEHGIGLEALPLGGSKSSSWLGVYIHLGACEDFLKLYRPLGRGFENVFDEQMSGDCNGSPPTVSVATPRGVKYVTRLCPNLARESGEDVPEFETWLAVPGDDLVFSQLTGRCDGWPAPDKFNHVFVIHGGDAGPVAAGYGVAWRGSRSKSWIVMPPYMFDFYEIDGSNDPETVGLRKADNFKTPSACGRKGCHRVARWIAPGVVAIDWYPASINPGKSIHSEFLMVPEWLDRR